MQTPAIKVCGLTSESDIMIVNDLPITYAGFVLFYKKSKRNLSLERAVELKRGLKLSIKSVAVTVSPTLKQVREIVEAGFDVIQIHGTLSEEVVEYVPLPIFRAVNVTAEEDVKKTLRYVPRKIAYFVFDGKNPGSGKPFDWDFLKRNVDNTSRIALAGGLDEKNVGEAITMLHPGIVDVSSSVEKTSGNGKDKEKTTRFVKAVIYRD